MARPTMTSFASPVPGSLQNTISGGPSGSQFPPPGMPQVLSNAINPASRSNPYRGITPPAGAAPVQHSANNAMNMMGARPTNNGGGNMRGSNIFLPANMKTMVDKWATQLGHKAYYESHGCVDPTQVIIGQQAQLAKITMMMGCNNQQASYVCELAQTVKVGGRGSSLRMLAETMMTPMDKAMYEQCLTPSTIMSSFMPGQQQQQQMSFAPPQGAAPSTKVNCKPISDMLMMSSSAAEGMMSPEHMEQIGAMRNKFFKMKCQESQILGSLPYRMCCPGHVKPPTMQEAMMLRGMGGA